MASLPILTEPQPPAPPAFARLYSRALSLWAGHVADEAGFDTAAVYANARLASVPEANCILGEIPPQRAGEIDQYFAAAHTRPLAHYLPGESTPAIAVGLQPISGTLWLLGQAPLDLPLTHPDLIIIPARASLPHAQQIAALMRPQLKPAEAAEAAMCHLDDPHVDALLALHQGQPIGHASVLSTGEAGFIMEFFIAEPMRHRGYARAMAGQVLDICARSLFRQVCCVIEETHEPAQRLASRLGFAPALPFRHRQRDHA